MDFNELRRINEVIKLAKQAQQIQQIQHLQKLNALLKQINDVRRQQEVIKEFCEEAKDQFWRGEKPTEQELEVLREKAGYDKKIWEDIVRELSSEMPPEKK